MIDWKRVAELHDELGADHFASVVELFLDEIEGIVMRLRQDDPSQLESDLYFLKGSASNLGFGSFANLCHQNEIEVRNGRVGEVDLGALMDCYAASNKEFVASPHRISGAA